MTKMVNFYKNLENFQKSSFFTGQISLNETKVCVRDKPSLHFSKDFWYKNDKNGKKFSIIYKNFGNVHFFNNDSWYKMKRRFVSETNPHFDFYKFW